VRIKEFKQLVKSFHDKGLSVVMDVVYNHTGLTEHSNSINWYLVIIIGMMLMATQQCYRMQ